MAELYAVQEPYPQELPVLTEVAFARDEQRKLSGPGMRTFLNIARQWGLSEQQKMAVLGSPARSTYHKWAKDAAEGNNLTLPFDTLVRISAVLGVHKALKIVFLTPEEGIDWLKQPNLAPVFAGHAPLDMITSGFQDRILTVRRHLDARRGGIFSAPTDAAFEHEPWSADDIAIVE
tara:strand:+ start:4296 stop:4823 length:528 start_codon:yes stop_codon:yes gene_type:complete